jgi:thymidylate synthase
MAICVTKNSLDDLLWAAINAVRENGDYVSPRKGPNRELRGVVLQLTNPRARLSRSESRGKVFSALGELLWYLSGSRSTEHIAYYLSHYKESDEGGIVFGGYGPRLVGGANQLATVIRLLRDQPSTRRAVIQLFEPADLLDDHKDVPCTCTLQFLNRGSGLDVVVYMRSNDVFIGLPHDLFCFSMIQELVARSLGCDVGHYIHLAGSLHLYDDRDGAARLFLDEGHFETKEMPPMPEGDPARAIDELLKVEAELRLGADPLSVTLPASDYWRDLARLLVIFALDRAGRHQDIGAVMDAMSVDVYDVHIFDRLDRASP